MEPRYGDSETLRRKETRMGSPDMEAGFNGEVVDNDVSFPFTASGGRDIMSIIMKRHVGGSGGGMEEDTEPVVKKARLTCENTASESLGNTELEAKKASLTCENTTCEGGGKVIEDTEQEAKKARLTFETKASEGGGKMIEEEDTGFAAKKARRTCENTASEGGSGVIEGTELWAMKGRVTCVRTKSDAEPQLMPGMICRNTVSVEGPEVQKEIKVQGDKDSSCHGCDTDSDSDGGPADPSLVPGLICWLRAEPEVQREIKAPEDNRCFGEIDNEKANEIAFNEIKANIDLLNGKASSTDTPVFSMVNGDEDTAKAVSSSQFNIETNVDDAAKTVDDIEKEPEFIISSVFSMENSEDNTAEAVTSPRLIIENNVDDTVETSDIKTGANNFEIYADKCDESTDSGIEQAAKKDVKIKQEPQELSGSLQDESHSLFDIVPLNNLSEVSGNTESSKSSECHRSSSSKSALGSSDSVEFNPNITIKQEIDSDGEIIENIPCKQEKDYESEINTNITCKQEIESDSEISSSHASDISKKTLAAASGNVNLPSDLDVLAAAAERRQQIDTKHGLAEGRGKTVTEKVGSKRKSRKQNMPRRISHLDVPELGGEDEREEKYRIEKSRKQNKPKRVTDLFTNYEDQLDEDKGIAKSCKGMKGIGGDHAPEVGNTDSSDETYYTNSSDQKPNPHLFSEGNFSMLNMGGIPTLPSHVPGQSMLPGSPFHNEMLATLSQNYYQNVAEKGQTGISNLEENLDVVRRLREIRFYKYRKISVAEKQEIASYAKLHSASAAAAHFGVSKSAVSMWTRTDFSDMKDEPGKRKRNCMLGNEKFEQLLERVKSERGNKFKALTKQDKFEVSRYAKLVGVREMARCLGIALGTVSGWMRQFPYTVKPANQEEENMSADTLKPANQEEDNMSADVNDDSINSNSQDNTLNVSVKQETDESQSCDSEDKGYDMKSKNTADTKDKESNQNVQVKIEKPDYTEVDESQSEGSGRHKYPDGCTSDAWGDDSNSKASSTETVEYTREDSDNDTDDTESQSDYKTGKQKSCKGDKESEIPEKNDELDEMIASTLVSPDIDQCYENIRDQIKDTPLENDTFFESLFRRVLSCRTDKYKTLKASEKLEVVRYAKRIGVRKVAKLLGLATGTLSGWNTKYQGHLGLTMDGNTTPGSDLNQSLDISQSRETPGCSSPNMFTPESLNSTMSLTPQSSSVLDNAEKSEVWAIKFLLKDQFPMLQEKIAIARQVKFRNIKSAEKIEIVKCAKLLGIRPTARVLGMPIGTLSGWMTKYTNTLHPVYHIGATEHVDYQASMANAVQQSEPTNINDTYQNDLVGRNMSMISSPHAVASPANQMSPYGFGLMPNSFSQNFLTGLSSPAGTSSGHPDELADGSSEESGQNNPEQLTSSEVALSSSIVSIEERTKRIAEQYVRMFHESQNM